MPKVLIVEDDADKIHMLEKFIIMLYNISENNFPVRL